MNAVESKVTKNVRSAVVNTAEEIEKLGVVVQSSAKAAFLKFRRAAEEAQRNKTRAGTEAKRISADVEKTIADAVRGFKQGVQEVRARKRK